MKKLVCFAVLVTLLFLPSSFALPPACGSASCAPEPTCSPTTYQSLGIYTFLDGSDIYIKKTYDCNWVQTSCSWWTYCPGGATVCQATIAAAQRDPCS